MCANPDICNYSEPGVESRAVPPLVSTGAMITCSMAMPPVPVPLTTIPKGTPVTAGTPAGTIQDSLPMANIPTFGMCGTLSNPVVAAATAAKLGVFSPAPCVPAVASPWTPGATKVMINNTPALHQGCQAMCMWGGVITISNPGNKGTVQVN
jgi:Domain of unknown function (DUF4280)